MGLHKAAFGIGLFATLLALAGCGGSGAPDAPSRQAGQADTVPATPVVADFVQLAQQESCGDKRNRLYLIDGKQVYWDRAGSCADNSYSQRLYGATPQTVLCEATDTLAGMKTFCANEAMRALFETIQKNPDTPLLGLDASHKVQYIPFLPRSGSALPFRVLARHFTSGVRVPQNVVVRDQAGFEELWSRHTSKQSPVPGMPKVDFATTMVVGIFMGERETCAGNIGIVRAGSQDGKMVVDYEDRAAPAGLPCSRLITAPMELMVMDRNDAPAGFVRHAVTLLPTWDIDSSTYSLVPAARNVVVKDQQGWAALWAEHAGRERALPEVDFGTQMVVGVFLGHGDGCSTTRIESVSSDGSKITVRHTDTVPGPATACTKNLTSPARIVAVERSELPVEFAREIAEFPGPVQSF